MCSRASLITALFVLLLLFPGRVYPAATITADVMPTAVANGGGTGTVGYPYAAFVRIQGWMAAAGGQAYLKIYNSTNNEYMWTGSAWSNTTTFDPANQPVVTLDAGGNWSGWIYAKHNAGVGVSVNVRAAKVGATGTNLTQTGFALNVLTMSGSGSGGWVVRPTSPAVNKGILAYANGALVGTYRTEDNGITEGYGFGAGGFKIAVPSGAIDSLVTLNDDGSRDQAFVGPWFVTPGQETDVSSGGGQVGVGRATVTPPLLSGGISHEVSVKIFPEGTDSIKYARVILPSQWPSTDVSVSGGGSPSALVSGDTVTVSSFTLKSGDTLLVQLLTAIPYDSTGTVQFLVTTGLFPDSLWPLKAQPSLFVYGTPMPIADARQNDLNGIPLLNNKWITVRGVVTVAGQLGRACYMQDNSGGLTVYDSAFSLTVHPGDEVIVSGLVQPFNGLMEIVLPVIDAVVGSGNAVEPVLVNAAAIASDGAGGVEAYEGRLVRLNGVSVAPGGTWTAASNYTVTDGTGSTEIRIDQNTNLPGRPIPSSAIDIVGVVGQFIGQSPYIGGYQVFPRSTVDILSAGPVFLTAPVESAITPTGFVINWQTVSPGSTKIRFGKTPALELGVTGSDSTETSHRLPLSGLDPATVYYCRAFSVAGPDTSTATTLVVSTASPAATTGKIGVYFNHSVDTALAWFRPAPGGVDLAPLLIAHINAARRSIDAALYSLSGTPGYNIALALANAKSRGVSVRVICETDNRNTTAFDAVVNGGIPLITDSFDPVNAGAGLMHNKFFVFDGRGGAPDSVWVWTGSWNPTQPGTYDDFQNSIEIQDAALAGAYTLEFNEMWGTSGDIPDASASRFGARKTDNTPHHFVIGGRDVECYFSPSDHTTSHILSTINGAAHSVAFDLLTLTRTDIASALVARKGAGVKVRGLIDAATDQGSQYSYLVAQSIDVHLKTGATGLLHHKYGIIDAENPAWSPAVITGSHNWTSSAENSNNENLLIVHDADVANQYLQEFAARYYQFGGSDSVTVGVSSGSPQHPRSTSLAQNFPNPFNPATTIGYQLSTGGLVSLKVYDILGRQVATLVDRAQAPGRYAVVFDGSRLASGVYFCRLSAGPVHQMKKMLLVR